MQSDPHSTDAEHRADQAAGWMLVHRDWGRRQREPRPAVSGPTLGQPELRARRRLVRMARLGPLARFAHWLVRLLPLLPRLRRLPATVGALGVSSGGDGSGTARSSAPPP